MESGLPQNTVQSLLASKSGYLWLGTELGLVRFDGYSFVTLGPATRPAFAPSDVRGIFETPSGALWVATGEGISLLRGNQVTNFASSNGGANGLPEGTIRGVLEHNGETWLWSESGIASFTGSGFKSLATLPGGNLTSVLLDRGNRLWATTGDGAYLLRDGHWNAFRTGACKTPGPALVTASDNDLLITCSTGVMRPDGYEPNATWHTIADTIAMPHGRIYFVESLPTGILVLASKEELTISRDGHLLARLAVNHELTGSRIQIVKADREGALWIGTNRGLFRWTGGKLETADASASILALSEDAEGNLWIGTESNGVELLRDERFHILGTDDGLSSDAVTTVVEDTAGKLWVGTNGGGLNQLQADHIQTLTTKNGLLSNVVLSLAAARDGSLWVGTPDGLNQIQDGRVRSFTSSDGLPDDFVRSLLADDDGSLWVGTRRGLAHWENGHVLQTLNKSDGLGSDLIGAMVRDGSGRLWIATLNGLSVLAQGKLHNYTTRDGLPGDVITALDISADGHLLVGTAEHGWSIYDHGSFSPIDDGTGKNNSVLAILQDASGTTWLATSNAIARCRLSVDRCSGFAEFGAADGLRSREMAKNSHPSAWRGHDGRLWFATPKGLVEVDPAHFHLNTQPPPVVIERMGVDDANDFANGDSAQPDKPLRITAGHVHFEFEYAALSFTAPQKIHYRYKLEGFDKEWTDAGTRRTAFYTNIPPGHYTFHVQAANNDGVWNSTGAELSFELRPHFYQTIFFWLIIALLLIAAAIAVARLYERRKLAQAEREFNAVLAERSRIAREIHDTLAQGYVGISVQLEVLSELVRKGKADASGEQLKNLREYVREGLNEARQSIWALRSPDVAERTLPIELQRLVEQAGDKQLKAQLKIHGAYRPLALDAEREFLRIAQEAIQNVKKHAAARRLEVELVYYPDARGVVLEVRDDGRGIEADLAEELAIERDPQSPPGHYGLTGMSERAAAIRAKLTVQSKPGKGTTVRVELKMDGAKA
jgi:signal transduction histidine kinase/ligand-binding sensor domain-containing protein